jgi:benzoate membrane transport protein
MQPVVAGVVTAVVGFTSSFAVVLAGLRAVGATPTQAGSGLLALCLAQGAGILWLTWRHRMPITLAWSTPGAALLVSAGAVRGGWPSAVGAFCVVGVLFLVTAAWPRLGNLIAAIPASVAQAMLAGVLLTLCLAPVRALTVHPLLVAPVLLVWLALLRRAPRWATPAALAVTLMIVLICELHDGGVAGPMAPHPAWTAPTLTWQALVGIALPLYVVTMASQNVPGAAVLASYGYVVPWRSSMVVTGLGTLVGAPAGGHTVNLAAITAALAASPEASPDPRRRWIASHTAGWAYLVLAGLSTALASVVALAPEGVVEAAAGLALLGALGSALAGAVAAPAGREAAVVTFVVAASGLAFWGVGGAFWALVGGLLVRWVVGSRRVPGQVATPVARPGDAGAAD